MTHCRMPRLSWNRAAHRGMPSKNCSRNGGQGDAIKIETGEEIVEEPDENLKKRKIGEPDINPGGASSSTTDTPKKRESEQRSSANESSLAGCIAAINSLMRDMPTVPQPRSHCTEWKIIEDQSRTRVAKHVEF